LGEHGECSSTASGWTNIYVIFRGLFGIVRAISKVICLFPRFLKKLITTFTGALFGERGSRGAEKPVLSARQTQETDSVMEIEDPLPLFRDTEKLIADAKKKILNFSSSCYI
jgi:hypothetical protein